VASAPPQENGYLCGSYRNHVMDGKEHMEDHEMVELSIDGVLDLHTFNPRDVKELLPHYLRVCREKGILDILVIHGKGGGTLRKTVHSILGKLPGIASFNLAGGEAGGWGATTVTLEPGEVSSSEE